MATLTSRAIADDGTVIGYRAVNDGAGESGVLLLVHSAAADARQWARLVPILATGFTVVCMDRRGRGLSGPLRPDHSLDAEYGDIAAVARSLPGPLHLLGHSSGARFALHAATRIPELASLTLYEPPAPAALTDAVMASLASAEASGDRKAILRLFFVDAVGLSNEDFAALESRPIWSLMLDNALTLPAELRAVRGYRFNPADVAGLTTPTLLLLGEESDADLAGVIHRLAGALRDATVTVLPGQGHGAMFSSPGLLASSIRDFIGALDR